MSKPYTYPKAENPRRVAVTDSDDHWIATYTLGSHTVTLTGPTRSLIEGSVSVTHSTWVRMLPLPFDGVINSTWLDDAQTANLQAIPDILAIAIQYIAGSPSLISSDGFQIAGDASYGPLDGESRLEGSDFNDYLGVAWDYAVDGQDQPEPNQKGCLDCSGYIRMVWGYRHSFEASGYTDQIPLSLSIQPDCSTLPRRAWQMSIGAPGIAVIPNQGVQVTDISRVSIGDLVFFDTDQSDGRAIDHVGMYLGIDSAGRHRFISSRKSINGPTFRDLQGKSVLDGTGYYAKAFRTTRRL
jgi:NlpC/P60 family